MLELTLIRRFLNPPVSAASGLVRMGTDFFLIADDEHFLLKFNLTGESVAVPLLPDHLPEAKADRKKRKADFESLLQLDQKTLLAMPSGSRPNRQRAVKVNLTTQGTEVLDYSRFFSSLAETISEINLEGAVQMNDQLIFLQRGNGERGENGLIRMTPPQNWSALPSNWSYLPVDLGSVEGCRYTFTDACFLNSHLLFTAVAEASASTYEDGTNLGAILGVLDLQGRILQSQRLPAGIKPEGICLDDTGKQFYLVTDDDDRKKPSGFYAGELPAEWLTL